MSHHRVRGTDLDGPHVSLRREYGVKDSVQRDFIGFRLVHDIEERVNRGGSRNIAAGSARVAYRSWLYPGYRGDDLGFRLTRGDT